MYRSNLQCVMTFVLDCGNALANDVARAPFNRSRPHRACQQNHRAAGLFFFSAATRSPTMSQACTPFTLRRLTTIGASRKLASRMVATAPSFDRGHDLPKKQCTTRSKDTVGAGSNSRRAMCGKVCIVARGLRRSVACLRGALVPIGAPSPRTVCILCGANAVGACPCPMPGARSIWNYSRRASLALEVPRRRTSIFRNNRQCVVAFVFHCGSAPANGVVHAPFQSIAASLQVT